MKLHHKLLSIILTLLLVAGIFTQMSLSAFANETDPGNSEYEEDILPQGTTDPEGTVDPEATAIPETTITPEEPTTEEPTTVEPTTEEPTTEPADPTHIFVSAEEIETYGAQFAIQTALGTASENATDDVPYTVEVEPGEYELTRSLFIYSNTSLIMNGVTLVRARSNMNLLRIGKSDSVNEGVTGYYYRNISIIGGVFDGSNYPSTMMKLTHASNVTLDGVTLTNNKNAHMIETAGVDGLTVSGCSFTNMTLDVNYTSYEALQLDILKEGNIVEARSEDLCMKNVTVENCLFDNCPRGVGSHTAVHNNPHTNINIRNNTFKNIKSAAIQTLGWTNSTITNNSISDAPKAIIVYSLASDGMGTFLPSVLAAEGNTTQHFSDSFKSIKSNIVISDNEIFNCGTTGDPYVKGSYEKAGISIIGNEITGTNSNGLPTGKYYCDTITVKNNLMEVQGDGIRVEKTNNIEIEGNVIRHIGKNTSQNDYGIVLRTNVTKAAITTNYISSSPVNAMQIYEDCTVDRILNNEIYTTGKHGIAVYFSVIGTISGNIIKSPAKEGIAILNESNVSSKITENRLTQTGDVAVHVSADSSVKLIDKNTSYNCAENLKYSKSTGKVTVGTYYTTNAAVTSVSASPSGAYLHIGESMRFAKNVSPINAITTFSYTSSNPLVATVDSTTGRITAKGLGTANITVKTANSKTAVCKVIVVNETFIPETSVKLNTTALTITKGNSYTLKATVSPSNANNKSVTWSSSNSSVASVSASGVVTAKKAGSCTITVKTNVGKTATCAVTVKNPTVAVTGIKLNTTAVTMTAGTKYTLKATISPSNATNKTLSWSSSNPKVAGMAAGGVINAKAAGTCTITVKSNNGKTATCKVTVKKKTVAVTSVKLNTTKLTITAGKKYTLKATINPSNATNKTLSWSSSNPKVASMSAGGVVNAKKKGSCTITVKSSNGKTAKCQVTVK